MTTRQARNIRTGIRMADLCWYYQRFGPDNEYYLSVVEGTRPALRRGSKAAFDRRLRKLREGSYV